MSARVFRRSISIALRSISAIFLLIGAAFAAESVTADPVDFRISEQPLDSALNEFARQSDREIFYASDVVDGVYANAVGGRYEPEDALDLLLADSGLEYSVTASDTFLVNDQRGASDSKNSSPAPILMAQNTSSQTQTTVSRRSEQGSTSIVTGRVTDARTGANLKGAQITIEETGQWTSTNDLGEFRLVNVPTGSVTLTVSYLGYARQTTGVAVYGDGASQNFTLRGGSEIEEIVVFGQRSARALALNQERTAENMTTVVSSDVLGKFPGATLAETLRRAPGITFQEDSLTGEGSNIIVRGVAPDLNQIRLDGQRLAEGSGQGRSPSIGNLLTDTIDEVKISKTLLPNQDSNGTGGLIEITTKGPLDRVRRFAQVSAETEWNDDFTQSEQLSGTLSGIFGEDDNFGLSASLQYRESDFSTVSYRRDLTPFGNSASGQYLPLASDGSVITSQFSLDPRLSFPFEPGVDEFYQGNLDSSVNDVNTETVAGTLTAQWHPFDHTDLRLSYTRTEQTIDTSRRAGSFLATAAYSPLPIDELGGDVRGAYVWEDAFFPGRLLGYNQRIATENDQIETDVFSLQGETNIGLWDFAYRISRSNGSQDRLARSWGFRVTGNAFGGFFTDAPDEFLAPEAFNNTIDGRIVSPFSPIAPGDSGLQLPMLSQAGFDFFNEPANYSVGPFDGLDVVNQPGENKRTSAAFSPRYNFSDSAVKYLEVGVEYEKSRFDFLAASGTRFVPLSAATLSLSELGITEFRGGNLDAVGINSGFLSATEGQLQQLFANLHALSSGPTAILEPLELSNRTFADEGTFTDEEELAAYVQGRIDIGDLEIIGGVRFTQVDVAARILTTPTLILLDGTPDPNIADQFRDLVDDKATQSDFLPRVLVNYRPTDNLVVRGGYFQSVARPLLENLSARQSLTLDLRPVYGPNGDQPQLTVRKGNPNLRPAKTHSFDLSIARYDDNAGVLQASVFYKNIEDFLEFTSNSSSGALDDVILPDDPNFQNLPSNLFLDLSQPINNDEPAEIWGVELNVQQQFLNLPGIWSGLGAFANYTYTDSEKFFVFNNVIDPISGELVDVEVSGVPFDQSPKHSGTIALTYNHNGVDALLSYSAQSERLRRFEGYGLSQYNDEDDTLDFRIEYQLDAWGGNWRVFAAGQDLLKGSKDPDSLSYLGDSAKYYTRGTFLGGRTFIVGFSGTY